MTLVEMIGVLAVIAVLAGVLVPVALRLLDRIALDREIANLQALGDAFQKAVMRARSIPDQTGWHLFLSTNAGMDVLSITTNFRNRQRVLLLDESSGSWIPGKLPYQQTPAGTTPAPRQVRLMLVSTIAGPNLPFGSSRYGAEFDQLWNSPPNTLPAASPWTGWTGRAEDVIIHRINLAPLFVRLQLGTYSSATNGMYNFNKAPGTNAAPRFTGFEAYYIRGTELNLYSGMPLTNLDLTAVLNEDNSYVYEGGIWRSSLVKAAAKGLGDISDIVAAFLAAQPNTNALNPVGNAQQVDVVLKFLDFMTNYNKWAAPGPDQFKKKYRDTLLLPEKQVAMMQAVQGLYGSLNGSNFFPYPMPCPSP